MMNILVKDVDIGAEYENIIYDFWINALLASGKHIKIFDFKSFDVRKYIGTKIDAVILAGFLENISINTTTNSTEFFGEFVGEYEIPAWFTNLREDVKYKKWLGIKTQDGIFLLSPNEIETVPVVVGENLRFNVGRFDLLGFKNAD
jgi:hypothetical protein